MSKTKAASGATCTTCKACSHGKAPRHCCTHPSPTWDAQFVLGADGQSDTPSPSDELDSLSPTDLGRSPNGSRSRCATTWWPKSGNVACAAVQVNYWWERRPPARNCWPHSLFWKRALSASSMASRTALATHFDGFPMLFGSCASRLTSLSLSICVATAPARRPDNLPSHSPSAALQK